MTDLDTRILEMGAALQQPPNPDRLTRIVIGSPPTSLELSRSSVFLGEAGQLLRVCLQREGLLDSQTWLTSSSPWTAPPTTPETRSFCLQRLRQHIPAGSRVLLCGAAALQMIRPDWKLTQVRGMMFDVPEWESVAICTYHPAAVLNDPFLFPDVLKDIHKFATQARPMNLTEPEIRICRSGVDISRMVQDLLAHSDPLIVDLETTSLDPLGGEIVAMGLQGYSEIAYQIYPPLLMSPYCKRSLSELLESPSIRSGAHNAGFDSRWVKHHFGIDWRPQIDTMLLHYVIDERSRDEDDPHDRQNRGGGVGIHGLKTLVRERFDLPDYSKPLDDYLAQLTAEWRKAKRERDPNFGDVPRDILSPYLARDTFYTWQLAHQLPEEARLENGLWVHDHILIPGMLAFRDVELDGVRLDCDLLRQTRIEFQTQIEQSEREIRNVAENPNFNTNSPKQIAELLFDKLKLPQVKGRSTDAEVMAELGKKYPIAKSISDARQQQKILGTYIDGSLRRVHDDGRLRGEFLLHGTRTGRLSSRNPNLQNIPTLIGPVIRNAYIASPGYTLIESDYSQLELRVAAWFSRDRRLLQFYHDRVDVHRMVASEVFHVPADQVTHDQRYIAKYIDFGILYGRQAASLARGELQCSVREAQSYIDSFLHRFDDLSRWMEETRRFVIKNGYSETAFGRRRRFPLILRSNRGEVEREAVNSRIQGTGSDLCLTSLTRIERALQSRQLGRVLLTVHDSILAEVKTDRLDEGIELMTREMETKPSQLDGPIDFLVDVKVGQSWGQLHHLQT